MRDVTMRCIHIGMFAPFLLTRPMRDVTGFHEISIRTVDVSTHTPHAGRD